MAISHRDQPHDAGDHAGLAKKRDKPLHEVAAPNRPEAATGDPRAFQRPCRAHVYGLGGTAVPM
jgi:hypothetical protein